MATALIVGACGGAPAASGPSGPPGVPGVDAAPAPVGERFRMPIGGHRELADGLVIRLEVRGHAHLEDGSAVGDFALIVSRGDERVEETMSDEEPWFEVVAFDHVVQVLGGINDAEVRIAPATDVAAAPISIDDAIDLVEAEAERRGIVTTAAGGMEEAGLARISLGDGSRSAVVAVVGLWTRQVLIFDQLAD